MIIALRVNRPMRKWHARLAERLVANGHLVHFEVVPRSPQRWSAHDLVLKAERVLYGVESSLFSTLPTPEIDSAATASDLTMDLTGTASGRGRVVEALFDGAPGEPALLAVLFQGRAPVISIRIGYGEGAVELRSGHPATERPGVLSHALDQVLVRLAGLLVDAVEALKHGEAGTPASSLTVSASRPRPLRFLAQSLGQAVARRVGAAKGRPNHWELAIRRLSGSGVASSREWPSEPFSLFLDDADHFYADPFPFEHDGRSYVFFEVFPYNVGKGVIGAVEVAEDGSIISPLRTVLEAPVHLSYPFVFAHDAAIFMLPEISATRCVQLFRADPFPYRWVAERILIEDVVVGDATLIRHEGRYWIFGAIAGDGGSSWDQLGLFYAPDLFGPWTAHPRNPVLVDASAARPAGAMWAEGDVLMRVAQDCRTGYGIGLTICRVDRLDPGGYAQTIVKRLGPPDGFSADGVHTLNRTSTIEVIDLRIPHAARRRLRS